MSKMMRHFAKASIKKGIASARVAGKWQAVQQFGIWANRFDFPVSVVTSAEGLAPPTPREGYEHLGYVVAQFMAFRDEIRTMVGPLSDETVNAGIQYSNLAEAMLAWPEAWKLLEIIMRAAPGTRSAALDSLVSTRLKCCEYTRLGKRFVWKFVP